MIAAAMLFGDVRHTANQAYNFLDGASHNGAAPRTSEMLQNMAAYGDDLRSYCPKGDPVCAGGSITADHLNYFDLYSESAAAWVHERLNAFDGKSTSPTSSKGETTAKATGTATRGAYPTISVHPGSNSTTYEPVTVPAYGQDSDIITYKPEPMTTVVTKVATVTSKCASKGSVYTEYRTVSVECPICLSVSKMTETASATGSKHTKPVWATQTNSKPTATGYVPVNNATASHYAPGSSSSAHPTPAPSVPVVGASAASGYLPQLAGVLCAVAAVLAL